jgi:hypothetical protein
MTCWGCGTHLPPCSEKEPGITTRGETKWKGAELLAFHLRAWDGWLTEEKRLYLTYLTQCINEMVLQSQLLHKIVNQLFCLAIVNNKLTILWGR